MKVLGQALIFIALVSCVFSSWSFASNGEVLWHQKISDTEGGFTGILDDYDLFGWSVSSLGDLDGDGVADLAIEGPIQYDVAVDAGVAKTKMPESSVTGRATVFIFPDLNTGSNTYKAVQRSANAVAVGPVFQGLNKPVNNLSRGCTVADIVNTMVITAIQAQAA